MIYCILVIISLTEFEEGVDNYYVAPTSTEKNEIFRRR